MLPTRRGEVATLAAELTLKFISRRRLGETPANILPLAVAFVAFDASGAIVGRATAGGYGHVVKQSIAIGYVQPKYSALGTQLQIEILGKRHPATVVHESPYDPDNVQLRS